MIRINLLGQDTQDGTPVGVWMAAYGASVVLTFGIFFFLYQSASSQIGVLTERKANLEVEVNKLKQLTKEVRDLESKKTELNGKLTVIATLKKSKKGPVHILDDLNIALPERAWVQDLNEKGGFLSITGMAIDLPTVSGFSKALEVSKFFKNPEISEVNQKSKDGINIQNFTIKSAISYSGIFESPQREANGDQSTGKKSKSS